MLPGTWTCFCHVCARKMMISVYFLESSSFLVRFYSSGESEVFLLHFFSRLCKCKNVDAMTFVVVDGFDWNFHSTRSWWRRNGFRLIRPRRRVPWSCEWFLLRSKAKPSARALINAKPVSHKNVQNRKVLYHHYQRKNISVWASSLFRHPCASVRKRWSMWLCDVLCCSMRTDFLCFFSNAFSKSVMLQTRKAKHSTDSVYSELVRGWKVKVEQFILDTFMGFLCLSSAKYLYN